MSGPQAAVCACDAREVASPEEVKEVEEAEEREVEPPKEVTAALASAEACVTEPSKHSPMDG